MTPLFSGTIYFAQVSFKTPGNNYMFSAADMQTIITYAQHAIIPISEFVQQYGPSSVSISPTPIAYTANMSSTSFTDSDLQGWVNDMITANALSSDSAIVVLVVVVDDTDLLLKIGYLVHHNATNTTTTKP